MRQNVLWWSLAARNTNKSLIFAYKYDMLASLPNTVYLDAVITEHRITGAATVLLAAVLWGTVGPMQVLTGSPAEPGALGSGRLLIGGLILMVPIAPRFPFRALLERGALPWVLVAAVSTALFQASFLYAIARTGAALGTTVALGCAPFATGIFAWWWMGDRPTCRWLVATVAAVLGCAVILAPVGTTTVDGWGIGFSVVSGCCYGAYTVSAKVFLGTGLPLLATIAPTLILGGILLIPFLLFSSPTELVAPSTLIFLAWSGLICTAIAYAAFAHGLNRTTAGTAGTLSLAEPLAAAALGILILGENLSVFELIGSLLLIAGLVIVSIPTNREQSPPPPKTRFGAQPERELLEQP